MPSVVRATAALCALTWPAVGHAQASAPAGGGFFDGLKSAVDQIASGVATGVKGDVTGENIVLGRIAVQSPIRGYLTCFKDVPGGLLSSGPITSLTQARAAPALVLTAKGELVSAQCSELQKLGLIPLVVPGSAGATAVGTAVDSSGFDARRPCVDVPPAVQPKYASRCASFDPKDPCAALPADGHFRNGQATLAGACDARRQREIVDKVNAYKPAK